MLMSSSGSGIPAMIMSTILSPLMIMPAVFRQAAHLPIKNPQDRQQQSSGQCLNPERALAYQVGVDPSAGKKEDHKDSPDQQHRHFQKQEKPPRPRLFRRGMIVNMAAAVRPVFVAMFVAVLGLAPAHRVGVVVMVGMIMPATQFRLSWVVRVIVIVVVNGL